MHLIQQAVKGVDPPKSLNPDMVPPSERGSAASTVSPCCTEHTILTSGVQSYLQKNIMAVSVHACMVDTMIKTLMPPSGWLCCNFLTLTVRISLYWYILPNRNKWDYVVQYVCSHWYKHWYTIFAHLIYNLLVQLDDGGVFFFNI